MTTEQKISQDTIISWVKASYLALEMDNISGDELFAGLNIPAEALTDPDFRIVQICFGFELKMMVRVHPHS